MPRRASRATWDGSPARPETAAAMRPRGTLAGRARSCGQGPARHAERQPCFLVIRARAEVCSRVGSLDRKGCLLIQQGDPQAEVSQAVRGAEQEVAAGLG